MRRRFKFIFAIGILTVLAVAAYLSLMHNQEEYEQQNPEPGLKIFVDKDLTQLLSRETAFWHGELGVNRRTLWFKNVDKWPVYLIFEPIGLPGNCTFASDYNGEPLQPGEVRAITFTLIVPTEEAARQLEKSGLDMQFLALYAGTVKGEG